MWHICTYLHLVHHFTFCEPIRIGHILLRGELQWRMRDLNREPRKISQTTRCKLGCASEFSYDEWVFCIEVLAVGVLCSTWFVWIVGRPVFLCGKFCLSSWLVGYFCCDRWINPPVSSWSGWNNDFSSFRRFSFLECPCYLTEGRCSYNVEWSD